MTGPTPIVSDPYEQLIRKARTEVQHFPRHEPSHWLRTTAEAAAPRLAALPGRWNPGTKPIVPLVAVWPPPSPDRPAPAHLCARCGEWSPVKVRGKFRSCGFDAKSEHHRGVLLRFTFELCTPCAVKEFGQ